MNPAPGDSLPGGAGGADERGGTPRRRPALPAVPTSSTLPALPARVSPPASDRLPVLASPRPADGPPALAVTLDGEGPRIRTGEIVTGRLLVAIGAPEGSEARPCPEDRIPDAQPVARSGGDRRPAPGAQAPAPTGPVVLGTGPGGTPLLERRAEVERLRGLLARGRSIRVTGPSGSGRSALLSAVADSCAGLAPDGVVRLTGYRRTPADLLQDLFAATHRAPGYRPDRERLPRLLAGVGAIVVIDDVEFGGAALDELLDSAPECAFLIATTPDAAAPTADSRLEESPLRGLSRDACLDLLAALALRPLDDVERAWAVDLWFESEGLPLRFVQAGALLRQRDVAADALAVAREERANLFGGGGDPDDDFDDPAVREEALRQAVPLPSVAESAAPAVRLAEGLSEPARTVLRLAVALGGQCPTAPHLPALVDVGQGESALHELVDCGLAVSTGEHHRLTVGVRSLLAAEWSGDDRDHGAAQHFAWWVGHSSVTPEQVAAEAEVLIAAMGADRDAGRHSSVVLLARAAAPALGLAPRWGAWEQTLRLGLEASRAVGAVADEAWFHHELGVLALATGAEDRARAEFEASVALRGALGDTAGTAAARRMLGMLTVPGALGGVDAKAPQARSMGQLPWRRGAAAREAQSGGRRKVLGLGAGLALLVALGAAVGLTTAQGHPAGPGPASSTPGYATDAGLPSDEAGPGELPSSAGPSASAGGTVEGTSRPPTATADPSASAAQSTAGPGSAPAPSATPSRSTGGGTGGGGVHPPTPTVSRSSTSSPSPSATSPSASASSSSTSSASASATSPAPGPTTP